jgi:hypothetical protein
MQDQDGGSNVTESHEIVPGRSIGPFRLGMTREEVEELDIGPGRELDDGSGTHYPLVEVDESAPQEASGYPEPGVQVHYGPTGRCHRLQAIFHRPDAPLFSLQGRLVNGMTGTELLALLHSLASDAQVVYASIESREAGLVATKWEASDERIMSIAVVPALRESESH